MNEKKKSVFIIDAAVFCAVLIIAVIMRFIQYLTVIEEKTGFYKAVDANVIIFSAIVAAAVFFFIGSAFAVRKSLCYDNAVAKRPASAFASLIMAAGLVISDIFEYRMMSFDASAYTVSASISSGIINVFTYAQIVCALISAVYFIAIGIGYFTGRAGGKSYKVLSLAPVLWCVFRLVIRFTRTVSYIRVSDLALEMLMICAFAIFFMAFARCNSDVTEEYGVWKLSAFAFAGALFALICFIPQAVLYLTGRQDFVYILSRPQPCDCAAALFMLVTVLTRVYKADKTGSSLTQ